MENNQLVQARQLDLASVGIGRYRLLLVKSGGEQLDKRKWYVVAAIAGVAIILFLAGFWRPGQKQDNNLAEQFSEEPTILVEIAAGDRREMKLESYIAGVVAGEMYPDWPLEAYKAQAIIARTYALHELTNGNTQSVSQGEISASFLEAQQYDSGKITDVIERAVQETRGQVALYEGKFIKGFFHAASGGITSTAEAAGLMPSGQEPDYIKTVDGMEKDEYLPDDVQHWSAVFSLVEVEQSLSSLGYQVRNISDIQISEKIEGNRAKTLKITYAGGTLHINAGDFRTALDPRKMKSTVITALRVDGGNFHVAGTGYGHGVGLSQWGAYSMAKDGKSAEEIVTHYFNDITIEKLWE